MATRIQVRRGTTSQWNTANPTLEEGEIGYNSTLGQIKVGDGSTSWGNLDYVVNSSALDTSLGSYIPDSEKSAINGVAELDASKNILAPAGIIFEGATADAYETTLLVTDPTADRTITFPNSTGTVALTTDLSSYATLANPTFTGTVNAAALTLSGDLTVNGTTTTVNSTTVNVTNAFVFEGTTADAFETTLTVTDPTADRTITLPDATGTVQLRVADVDDTEIGYLNGVTSSIQTQLDARIAKSLVDAKGDILVASANDTVARLAVGTNGYILTANSGATNGIEWAAAPISLPSQTGNSGKYLTTDGSTASWGTVSSYSAPTIGSTSIASGATVTTIAGLTLTAPNIGAATGTSLTTTGGGLLARAASTQDGVEIRGRAGGTGNWEVILTPTTLSADRTLTLPNETGTLLTSAQFSAKGILLVGTGTGTFTTQSVGTNGQVLAANSAQADGVEWITPAGGAAFSEFLLVGC